MAGDPEPGATTGGQAVGTDDRTWPEWFAELDRLVAVLRAEAEAAGVFAVPWGKRRPETPDELPPGYAGLAAYGPVVESGLLLDARGRWSAVVLQITTGVGGTGGTEDTGDTGNAEDTGAGIGWQLDQRWLPRPEPVGGGALAADGVVRGSFRGAALDLDSPAAFRSALPGVLARGVRDRLAYLCDDARRVELDRADAAAGATTDLRGPAADGHALVLLARYRDATHREAEAAIRVVDGWYRLYETGRGISLTLKREVHYPDHAAALDELEKVQRRKQRLGYRLVGRQTGSPWLRWLAAVDATSGALVGTRAVFHSHQADLRWNAVPGWTHVGLLDERLPPDYRELPRCLWRYEWTVHLHGPRYAPLRLSVTSHDTGASWRLSGVGLTPDADGVLAADGVLRGRRGGEPLEFHSAQAFRDGVLAAWRQAVPDVAAATT